MRAATVSIHGSRVGQLERLDDWQNYVFSFDRAWLATPDRPCLGQIFIDRMPNEIRTSGMPCWFDHLLPQGPSRRLFQRIHGLDESDDDSFELLLSIGEDLPGAVVVEVTSPRLSGSRDQAAWQRELPERPGISLPGAQNKLSIRAGERGLVIPARGELGAWIAKFDDPKYPGLPTLEYATTRWAQAAGVRTHSCRLADVGEFADLPAQLPLGDRKVLLADRFDRSGDQRIHVEDFGQILDLPAGDPQYQSSYEDIGRILETLAPKDVREYVERVVFMIVCGNGDAHVKNWGVVYPDQRHPRLSPAYDLVATVARVPKDTLALTLAGDQSRDFARVTIDTFRPLGKLLGREDQVLTWVHEARDKALDAWSSLSGDLPLSERERKNIDLHLNRVPLCKTAAGG